MRKKILPKVSNFLGGKVEVTFKDGEVLVGSTLGYDPKSSWFFRHS